MDPNIRVATLLLLFGLLASACDEPPSDTDRSVVAFVGDEAIYLQELQNYLRVNLIPLEGRSSDPGRDEVRSRLFDAMLDERMLLAEAERRGMEVSDLEVEAFLDFGAIESIDEEVSPGLREFEARRQLMVQKLQEEVVRRQPAVTDEEVASWAELHRERLLPQKPVELRALRLRSMAQAERIHREIRRRRMTFLEAVIAHEASPGESVPRRISFDGLPPEVREALRELKPGQVSKPVELHGAIYLFQVASWLRDPGDLEAELSQRAREELEARRRKDALDAFVRELRRRSQVQIKPANLPFAYVPAPEPESSESSTFFKP